MNDTSNPESDDQAPTLMEALIIERTLDAEENPRRHFVDHTVLRETSRTAITAQHSAILNEHTGEIHHHAVKISDRKKLSRSKGGGWTIHQPIHIWINDETSDEIGYLHDFLATVRSDIPHEPGQYMVVRLEEGQDQSQALRQLIDIASSTGKAEALLRAIEAVRSDAIALERLAEFAASDPSATEVAMAALNLGRCRSAVDELERLIVTNAGEQAFQTHLEKNYWLFGTDYCERLKSRHLTRDEKQDFVVRRTTDNYIEILEIKTPLEDGQKLFVWDSSHKSYYASSDLSKVVGQVIKYIERLDANRQNLRADDGLDPNKIRARIVIGRDINEDQVAALRNFNGHLHRIEVLTFDQLLRIGRQAVQRMESVIESKEEEEVDVNRHLVGPNGNNIGANDFDDVPF